MNFDEAIQAHTKWKIRLRQFINGSGEKLDSAKVCQDNLCDLGKWIYGEGAKYKNAVNYKSLQTLHAEFHKCAAEVVKKMDAGDKKSADDMLEGAFAAASGKTVYAIMALKKEVGG